MKAQDSGPSVQEQVREMALEPSSIWMVRRSGHSGGDNQGPSRENSTDRLGSGLNRLLDPTEPQCGEVHIIGAQLIFWKE